ncbi:MAG: hypothetical protein ABFS32_20175 [Bacteroidota bacterium]
MSHPIHLFWTSGWDSTYRLLYLTFVCKQTVQPIYIVENKGRASVNVEMQTMDFIYQEIKKKDPETAKLIRPTIYKQLTEIQIDDEISDAYERITKKLSLGGQYVYLASYAKNSDFNNIELCIERLCISRQDSIFELLSPLTVEFKKRGFKNYRMSEINQDKPAYKIFGRFDFPLIFQTKSEMRDKAKGYGFIDILKDTWFCHSPLPGNIPCGVCPPCCYAIEDGFTWRFPEESLKRYKKSIKRRIYFTLKKQPLIFWCLRHVKGFLQGKKSVVD